MVGVSTFFWLGYNTLSSVFDVDELFSGVLNIVELFNKSFSVEFTVVVFLSIIGVEVRLNAGFSGTIILCYFSEFASALFLVNLCSII